MKTFTNFLFVIVLALSVLRTSSLPSRQRRQSFNWGSVDDDTIPIGRPTPSTTTSSNGGTTTTTASPRYTNCIRRCPTTPQYNPICGNNQITYPNESHLRCAVSCGLNVERAFGGTCQAL